MSLETIIDMEQQEFANMGKVSDYYKRAKVEVGRQITGEGVSIEDAIVLTTARSPFVLGGPPGAAKTKALLHLVEVFYDASADNIAVVPGVSDITPTSLVGGRFVTEELDEDDNVITKSRRNIPGIINRNTVFIRQDEYPRLGKKAREALFPVLEERKIRSIEGEVSLPNLLGSVATQNLARRDQRIELAEASRFAGGVLFDAGSLEERKAISMACADGDSDPVEPIKPFLYIPEFKAIQNSVILNRDSRGNKLVKFATNLKEHVFEYEEAIQGAIQGIYGETEAVGRMSGQIGRLSRAYAMANESEHVQAEHVLRAAQVIATGRVIMLSTVGTDLKARVSEVRDNLKEV